MVRKSALTRFLCWALSVIFVLQPIAAIAAEAGPVSGEEAFIRLTEEFDTVCSMLEEALPEIPRDTFDPGAVIEKAGSDPSSLLDWVAKSTALVPYLGMLRGAEGVLMDRMGNSLDRALLLCRLLETAGREVRLARGVLSDEELEKLASRIASLPLNEPAGLNGEGFSEELLSRAEEKASERGLDGPSVRAALEKQASASAVLRAEAKRRTESQTDELMKLLGGITEKADRAAGEGKKKALRNHWWVQVKKDGTWADLDPSSPDEAPLTAALEFFTPDKIPEDLRHRVDIRVIAEVTEKGGPREELLLENSVFPFEGWGQRITLVHSPTNWPRSVQPLSGKMTPENFRAALLDQKEWVPMLLIDSRAHYQKGISEDGAVNNSPSPGWAGAGKGLGSALGGFGAKLDSIGGGNASGDGSFTALWIEYKITSPGREEVVRREVFDLTGPAGRLASGGSPEFELSEEDRIRRAAALLTVTDITVLPGSPSAPFMLYSYAKSLIGLREKVRAAARAARDGASEDLLRDLESSFALPVLPKPLWLAAARDSWGGYGGYTFTAGPVVLAWHGGVRFEPERDNLAFEAFDIVSSPAEPMRGTEGFRARLARGVLDTNAEALAMREAFRTGENRGNAGEAFDKSLKDGEPWVLIKSPDDPALDKLPVNAAARVRTSLAEGRLAAIPTPGAATDEEDFAWWRIDPATGETLGIGPMGWGSEFVEYFIAASMPFTGVFTLLSCMGNMNAWKSASVMKIMGCIILSTVSGLLIGLPLVAAGTAGTIIGISGGLAAAGLGAVVSWYF